MLLLQVGMTVWEKPSLVVSTIRIEMPLWRGSSGLVRAASQMKSAESAPEVHSLLPLTTKCSPSSRAEVFSVARSLPAAGSE
ncbi:hypothetical protein D3C81_1844070 [compost metagenome]